MQTPATRGPYAPYRPGTCKGTLAQGVCLHTHDVAQESQARVRPTAIQQLQSPSSPPHCAIRIIVAQPSVLDVSSGIQINEVSLLTTLYMADIGVTSTLFSGYPAAHACCKASISSPVESASHGLSRVHTKWMYKDTTCPRHIILLFKTLGRGTSTIIGALRTARVVATTGCSPGAEAIRIVDRPKVGWLASGSGLVSFAFISESGLLTAQTSIFNRSVYEQEINHTQSTRRLTIDVSRLGAADLAFAGTALKLVTVDIAFEPIDILAGVDPLERAESKVKLTASNEDDSENEELCRDGPGELELPPPTFSLQFVTRPLGVLVFAFFL